MAGKASESVQVTDGTDSVPPAAFEAGAFRFSGDRGLPTMKRIIDGELPTAGTA
jgi:hypothetical protein